MPDMVSRGRKGGRFGVRTNAHQAGGLGRKLAQFSVAVGPAVRRETKQTWHVYLSNISIFFFISACFTVLDFLSLTSQFQIAFICLLRWVWEMLTLRLRAWVRAEPHGWDLLPALSVHRPSPPKLLLHLILSGVIPSFHKSGSFSVL